jgi:uncharacterized protein YjeT (DUF2065 family)
VYCHIGTPASVMFENERHQGPRLIIAFHSTGRERGGGNNLAVQWILALRGLVLMAAPKLYERAAMSMDAIPLVRLIFGVIVAIGLCLTYVAWLAKPPSPSAKTNEANDAG